MTEAELAGLPVRPEGDHLVIRGPRIAEPVAKRLLANKPVVFAALLSAAIPVYETQAISGEYAGCVDVDNVDAVYAHWDSPDLIDPSALLPCPRCTSLEKWWPAVGEPRCQTCDPPLAAWNLLERVEAICKRLFTKSSVPRFVPAKPHCDRCSSTDFINTPIHGGRSSRRDCAQCGHTIGFPRWFDRIDDRLASTS